MMSWGDGEVWGERYSGDSEVGGARLEGDIEVYSYPI
jgi:hypothetical protein